MPAGSFNRIGFSLSNDPEELIADIVHGFFQLRNIEEGRILAKENPKG